VHGATRLTGVHGLDVSDARPELMRLAGDIGVTVTDHAPAIINAQNDSPQNPA
jgi:hypothetical protein